MGTSEDYLDSLLKSISSENQDSNDASAVKEQEQDFLAEHENEIELNEAVTPEAEAMEEITDSMDALDVFLEPFAANDENKEENLLPEKSLEESSVDELAGGLQEESTEESVGESIEESMDQSMEDPLDEFLKEFGQSDEGEKSDDSEPIMPDIDSELISGIGQGSLYGIEQDSLEGMETESVVGTEPELSGGMSLELAAGEEGEFGEEAELEIPEMSLPWEVEEEKVEIEPEETDAEEDGDIQAVSMEDTTALDEILGIRELKEDDKDVTELLDGIDGDDELSEINSLLKKSDNNEMVEEPFDFFLGMEETDMEKGEETPETDEPKGQERQAAEKTNKKDKKKKEKKEKKKKETGEGETSEEIEDIIGNMDGSGKKKSFISSLFGFLTEEAEELEEAEGEESSKKKKKSKKGAAGGQDAGDENTAILQEMEAEDKKADKKKKDPKEKKKKEKPKKKEKAPKADVKADEGKKLKTRSVVLIFLFCYSMMAVILVFVIYVPLRMDLQTVANAYYTKDYETVYQILAAKKLSKDEQAMFDKTVVILQLERKYDSYENYQMMGKDVEALDALLNGVKRYHTLYESAQQCNVLDEWNQTYSKILSTLEVIYQLSEEDAQEINSYEDKELYTNTLYHIIHDGNYSIHPQAEETASLNDLLPEEEALLQQMQNQEDGSVPPLEEGNDAPAQDGAGKELFQGAVKDGGVIVDRDISKGTDE